MLINCDNNEELSFATLSSSFCVLEFINQVTFFSDFVCFTDMDTKKMKINNWKDVFMFIIFLILSFTARFSLNIKPLISRVYSEESGSIFKFINSSENLLEPWNNSFAYIVTKQYFWSTVNCKNCISILIIGIFATEYKVK